MDREKKSKLTGEALKEFLKKVQKRAKIAIKADEHNRNAAIEDLEFVNNDMGMWDTAEKQRRKVSGRPCLQVNLLNKNLNQVKNEIRLNRPRVKVRPIDSHADVKVAKIRQGLIMDIGYLSREDAIYDEAGGMASECGYGAWRIGTRRMEENPFLQEIYMELIENPFVVYLDPGRKDPTGSDSKWGFLFDKLSKEEFEDAYPNAEPVDFKQIRANGIADEHWYDDKENLITIAEYWEVKDVKKKVCLMSDGTVMDEGEAKKAAANKQMDKMPIEILDTKETEKPEITQYIVSGAEMLEDPTEWAGSFIPLIEVRGRTRNIKGKRYIKGMIRDAKGPSQMFNYFYTSAAEHISLSPKSPWQGTAKQFEGYEKDYLRSHIDNLPMLRYKVDKDAPGPPTRTAAPQPPVALFQAINDARQNVKDSMGMFNADVGDQGQELSGEAIKQRQKPGDIGTFDFYDNLVRSIAHSYCVINDLIPHIYDTKRDIRVRNIDNTETFVPINTDAGSALQMMEQNKNRYQGLDIEQLRNEISEKGVTAKYNDIISGKYGVVVDTGPTFATQRQESARNFMELLNSPMGQIIERIAPDLAVKNMDFLDADEMAERMRRILPQGLVQPKPGEKPPMPLPPPPATQLMMLKSQTEQAKQQTQKIAMQVKLIQLYKESKDTDTSIRQEILNVLAQLHKPIGEHPHDASQRMKGQKPPQMPQQGGPGNEMPQQ